MKKRLFGIGLGLLCVGSLASCGEETSSKDNTVFNDTVRVYDNCYGNTYSDESLSQIQSDEGLLLENGNCELRLSIKENIKITSISYNLKCESFKCGNTSLSKINDTNINEWDSFYAERSTKWKCYDLNTKYLEYWNSIFMLLPSTNTDTEYIKNKKYLDTRNDIDKSLDKIDADEKLEMTLNNLNITASKGEGIMLYLHNYTSVEYSYTYDWVSSGVKMTSYARNEHMSFSPLNTKISNLKFTYEIIE